MCCIIGGKTLDLEFSEISVLISYASSQGSGEPAQMRKLARAIAARKHTQLDRQQSFKVTFRPLVPTRYMHRHDIE